MSATVEDVLQLIKEEEISFVDLRFTDTRGKEQHVSVGTQVVDEDFFAEGKMFDGSSIDGWKSINESDMILQPDVSTALVDPFFDDPTLIIRCDIIEPTNNKPYSRDPRSLAKRAEKYLQSTKIADQCIVGPEPEFFIFDDVRWEVGMSKVCYSIDSKEAAWNSGREYDGGNVGHRPGVKGGYFPVPPVDSSQDIRSAMCLTMQDMGMVVETHHHEVATSNQCEIGILCGTLLDKADELQMFKYIVHNVAHVYGKTATFMPKPLVGDNGSGMHVHQSLMKGKKNIFAGKKYQGLSQEALYYIGGIIKHARALNAFTNAGTNSYKRLVPGFEAPVILAYSGRNRSAAIRVPYTTSDKGRRIEVRFPDATANPYFAFSAMLMAGLDGIQNKIDPGDALDQNLYEASKEELAKVGTVAPTLMHAIEALQADHEFLLQGDVFNKDLIDAYIEMKQEELQRLLMITHPVEFDLYYSC